MKGKKVAKKFIKRMGINTVYSDTYLYVSDFKMRDLVDFICELEITFSGVKVLVTASLELEITIEEISHILGLEEGVFLKAFYKLYPNEKPTTSKNCKDDN